MTCDDATYKAITMAILFWFGGGLVIGYLAGMRWPRGKDAGQPK